MNLTAIAIVGIICWALVELVNSRHKKAPKAQDLGPMQQEIEKLRERVQVLEKIVTDENYDLKRQFDNLKND
ncbi:hypothetical protein P2G88_11920 [Aliiglaciecola sp. CAU 1673]|uniref:hypothetical protein n=1 Tax=Aliiglaciecola sp. CAU 1673 TaxID=3032595 RepID=UPI0023DBEFE9|nr:hypothetical protein [Aliiglaciecola sp. CAU 1673]MDF2178957.1 hypothetical protein [Aliiglaciecola sp. CAU 1673]